ncbi:MAG TPA: HXXEE domain-containing protein [Gemmatimonadaceae bacterium]|nr:HXXEE domain-containing protein [Gemmatimonadaceae bacterium]
MLLSRLSYRSLQRLMAGVIALHNGEEALTAGTYLPRVREYVDRVPELRDAGLPPSLHQLYFGLAIVTVVPALLVGWATTGRDSVAKREVVAVVAAGLLWNVFLPHLSAMVFFRGYAPGGLTALTVNLPMCVYFFRRSVRERMLSGRQLTLALVLGLILLVIAPLLLLL